MQLSSSAFFDGDTIPRRYTCDGANVSPPLAWSDPPPETQSFVLLCDDPDAPSGTFHHWAIYDIGADNSALAEGADATAAGAFKRGINDFGVPRYRGPCPPHGHGPHHYHFRVLALAVAHLRVAERANCRQIAQEAQRHALAEAQLVATYER